MTEQQTPDREKKIAEIREALRRVEFGTYRITAFADLEYWLRFLLSELERLERKYGYALDDVGVLREENRKLREDLEGKPWREFLKQVELEEKLQSAQQEIERLREERDKLIEVLRWYADAVNYEYRTSYLDQDAPIIDDSGQRARDILREVGVTVE